MKGNIFSLGIKTNGIINKIKYFHFLKKFLKNYTYDIVHINSGSIFFNYITALAVKQSKKSKIIVHCHNSMDNINILKKIFNGLFKPFLSSIADYYLSCSLYAGKQMFTKKIINSKKFYVLPNAIDIDKFKFDEDIRKKIRKKFKIKDDDIVIGHIGRFELQKNHNFIIEMFNEINKKNKNIYLFLIGDGSLKKEIFEKVKRLNLEKNVIFTGLIKNVNEYLNAFDIFILPSLYEGFPVTLVEAQANGLTTLVSKNVTDETSITDLISYLDLIADEWCNKILNIKINKNRLKYNHIIKKTDYEIQKASKTLLKIYLDVIGGIG